MNMNVQIERLNSLENGNAKILLYIFNGGFRGPSSFYIIEKKDNKYLKKYGFSQYGSALDITDETSFTINEVDKKTLYEFFNRIKKSTRWWRKYYNNKKILDGTQWEITFYNPKISWGGSNKFPLNYKKVMEKIDIFFKEK